MGRKESMVTQRPYHKPVWFLIQIRIVKRTLLSKFPILNQTKDLNQWHTGHETFKRYIIIIKLNKF